MQFVKSSEHVTYICIATRTNHWQIKCIQAIFWYAHPYRLIIMIQWAQTEHNPFNKLKAWENAISNGNVYSTLLFPVQADLWRNNYSVNSYLPWTGGHPCLWKASLPPFLDCPGIGWTHSWCRRTYLSSRRSMRWMLQRHVVSPPCSFPSFSPLRNLVPGI